GSLALGFAQGSPPAAREGLPCALQVSALGGISPRAAENRDRKNTKVQAADIKKKERGIAFAQARGSFPAQAVYALCHEAARSGRCWRRRAGAGGDGRGSCGR